ncbi:hypothetical protein NP493_275g01032 [Ridgeia piscesae]|uniref:G-protein coupled receptors family 1 profile domain-containing protein n=1 Tax=Ridgeia piscesae TaxID=27915 RepID=A0AAD9NXD9_RIDPI|nr:hypothetical protein NP493_275g01032 [Ridgeia piscesae]
MANVTTLLAPDITNHEGGSQPSRAELYAVMVILSFLSVLGTGGNAMVLYVFARKRDRFVSTLFILALAFVDFITCLVVMPFTIYMEYVDYEVGYDIVCKIYLFLITSNIPFSALTMAAIAVDRYFCICHPFLHAITLQRARVIIVSLMMFAGVLGIVVSLMHGVYDEIPKNGTAGSIDDSLSTSGVGLGLQLFNLTRSTAAHNQSLLLSPGYAYANVTTAASSHSQSLTPQVFIVFTGHCVTNELVLGSDFQWYYQKFYTSMYLVCLIVVVVLYIMIYKSVLFRRTQRQKQKNKSLYLIEVAKGNATQEDGHTEHMLLGEMKDASNGSRKSREGSGKPNGGMTDGEIERTILKKSKEKVRMANLKTAAMLFVVTVVFIVTFTPAFLMALQLMPYNMTVFYMYFANNVANPLIYSFMNKNFRDDLRKLFS